jgi:hypothetical protein
MDIATTASRQAILLYHKPEKKIKKEIKSGAMTIIAGNC